MGKIIWTGQTITQIVADLSTLQSSVSQVSSDVTAASNLATSAKNDAAAAKTSASAANDAATSAGNLATTANNSANQLVQDLAANALSDASLKSIADAAVAKLTQDDAVLAALDSRIVATEQVGTDFTTYRAATNERLDDVEGILISAGIAQGV